MSTEPGIRGSADPAGLWNGLVQQVGLIDGQALRHKLSEPGTTEGGFSVSADVLQGRFRASNYGVALIDEQLIAASKDLISGMTFVKYTKDDWNLAEIAMACLGGAGGSDRRKHGMDGSCPASTRRSARPGCGD